MALRVQQVELGVGLVEHEVGEKAVEIVAKALAHAEQIAVLCGDALEKRVGAVVARLVLETLVGEHQREHHAQRGEQAGEADGQRQLGPNVHALPTGHSRIL